MEWRIDDVFIVNHLTGSMKISLRFNDFFGHFKEMDKILAKYDTPCILSVLAEGIEIYPEWVAYIKERMYRYTIEMHGFDHQRFSTISEEEGYRQLAKAKEMIEKEFKVKINNWFVPFKSFPKWGVRVCDRLGIRFHEKGSLRRHITFHYWNSRDRAHMAKIIRTYYE